MWVELSALFTYKIGEYMNKQNYYRYCNVILFGNLILALLTLGISFMLLGAEFIWPICFGFAGMGWVIYIVLKRKIEELSEEEKGLHQSFVPIHIALVVVLLLAVTFPMYNYIIPVSNLEYESWRSWEVILYIFWGAFMVSNVLGAFFINWLEKLLYKLRME